MTVHSVTGITPNMAMLGREVLTPVTLIAQPPNESLKTTVQYVASFRDTMREAHNRIREATRSTAKTQKTYFDKYVKGPPFAVGQLVWLYWPRPLVRQTKKKLTQLWTGPWKIKQFKSPVVVEIQNIHTHKYQTVHVDRITTCTSQTENTAAHVITQQTTTNNNNSTALTTTSMLSPMMRRSSRKCKPPAYLSSYV